MISKLDSGYYAVKLCIMGDGGVGKTTLVQRLSTGRFNPKTQMTIGIDFSLIHHTLMIEIDDYISLDITVWDLGGEDRFRFMLPSYIQGADGGLLLYDVTRFTSAMSLPAWAKMWRENTRTDTPLYLIGLKIDLVKEREIPMIESNLNSLKEVLGINVHFLISSKMDQAVNQVINTIASEMLNFKAQCVRATSSYGFGKIF